MQCSDCPSLRGTPGTPGYSRVLQGTPGYSGALQGTPGYSGVLKGTQRYSRVLKGTQGYSRVLQGTWACACSFARSSRSPAAHTRTHVLPFVRPPREYSRTTSLPPSPDSSTRSSDAVCAATERWPADWGEWSLSARRGYARACVCMCASVCITHSITHTCRARAHARTHASAHERARRQA